MEKEYKQLSCQDFGGDCHFMVRAETEDEIVKICSEHGCSVHGKCENSPEIESKVRSLIKTVHV